MVLLILGVMLCMPVYGLTQADAMPVSDTWENRIRDLTQSIEYLTICEPGMNNQINLIIK